MFAKIQYLFSGKTELNILIYDKPSVQAIFYAVNLIYICICSPSDPVAF